jgi:hypothetical protein
MRKTLTLILAMLAVACLAQEAVPTRRILPEDIVRDSIQLFRFPTNRFTFASNGFAVRWTYTEAGAKKMLAFREANEGKKVRTVIGEFEGQPGEMIFRPMPPLFTNYAQWKEGWLKHRRDKIFGVSEEDAKKIMAGLKSK